MPEIAVSILDVNVLRISRVLDKLDALGVRRIHLDIIDTSFAPNISFGPAFVNAVTETDFEFELHMMVGDTLPILQQIDLSKVSNIAVHSGVDKVKNFIREKGSSYGLQHEICVGHAMSPGCATLEACADYALVMTVQPGFGNQKFISRSASRIQSLAHIKVGVDGGINTSNISQVKAADYVVVGSAITRAPDMEEAYRQLQAAMADYD